MQTANPTLATHPFMSGPILNATPAELIPSTLSLNEARRRPSSYRLPSIYTRPHRQRARIAPLCCSPISSFTILSTLPMASDEPFSGILPGWVAHRALRIRARLPGASPTSLGPMEPVAAPSRRVVQQLAAPVQLDEEWRVAPRRHGGEHTGTGVVPAASYRATSVCVAAPLVSFGAPPVPAAAPCRQRQKPGVWRATSRWPASPCPPPSSRRSRTREAATTWDP